MFLFLNILFCFFYVFDFSFLYFLKNLFLEFTISFDFQDVSIFSFNYVFNVHSPIFEPFQIISNQMKILASFASNDDNSFVIRLFCEGSALFSLTNFASIINGIISILMQRNSFEVLVNVIRPGLVIFNNFEIKSVTKIVKRTFQDLLDCSRKKPELIFNQHY